MTVIEFSRNDVRSKNYITVNAAFPEEDHIKVKSLITGKVKDFYFDREETSDLYERNEGWDGEEYHKLYKDDSGEITLNLWHSPYCGF